MLYPIELRMHPEDGIYEPPSPCASDYLAITHHAITPVWSCFAAPINIRPCPQPTSSTLSSPHHGMERMTRSRSLILPILMLLFGHYGRVEHSCQNPALRFRLNPEAIRSGFGERVRKRDFSSSANTIRVT